MWIKHNRLLSIIILVCVGFFAYYLYNAMRWIPYPNSIDYGEGFVMNYAKLWANGSWKWDVNVPPYLTLVYGVGFPILAYPFVKLFGSTLLVGRAISFVSALVVCFLIYLIVKGISGRKSYAVLASLLPATQPIFRDWSVMARVDMPAVMFDMVGFYLAVRFKNSKWFYLALIPLLIAPMVKLTAVAGLIAVGVYLLIYNRKRLFAFVGLYIGGLVIMFAILMIVSGGEYLKHTILYQNTIQNIYLGTFYFLISRFLYSFLIMLIVSIVYLRICWHKRDITLASLFFVIALAIDVFTTLRPGGSGMYYFEAIIAGSICASLGLPYVIRYLKYYPLQFQHIAIIGVLIMVFGFYGVKHDIESPDNSYTKVVATVESIMSDSQKPIITENPAIALNMGKDLYIEYFIFANMARLGYWDETPYVEKYKEQYFDYVLLRVSLEERMKNMSKGIKDGNFTNSVLTAINDNYSLVYSAENEYFVYSLFLYEANGKLANDGRMMPDVVY